MARWNFQDNVISQSYNFDVNPNRGGTPSFQKNLSYSSTPAGSSIVFEGRDKPRTFTVSGTLREEAQLIALQTWFDKEYQVKITDDLGREFWIYITNLQFERAQTRRWPFRHTFTINYVEVDWQ